MTTTYAPGTRGLDPRTRERLGTPLKHRIDQLVTQGRRFPLHPSERTAAEHGAPVAVRFFIDGDVLWAELRD